MRYLAKTTETTSVKAAGYGCILHAQREQAFFQALTTQATCGVCASASAVADLLLRTGVVASVFFFTLLIIPGNLPSVSLISLLILFALRGLGLRGLTGLVLSLVGLMRGLFPETRVRD